MSHQDKQAENTILTTACARNGVRKTWHKPELNALTTAYTATHFPGHPCTPSQQHPCS